MAELTGETFFNVRVRESIEGPITFERCRFDACSLAVTRTDTLRLSVTDVTLRECHVAGGALRGVALTDCTVDGLRTNGNTQVLGCTFDRVTLRGKVNRLLIDRRLPSVDVEAPFVAAADQTDAAIDWALDLTDVDSPDLEVRGVPARLILADPATAAVITRQTAERGEWRDADLSGTSYAVAFSNTARFAWPDRVLVAPRTGAKAARAQQVLAMLVSEGLATLPRTRD